MLIAKYFLCLKLHTQGKGGSEEGQEGMEQVEGGGGMKERKKKNAKK